MITVHRFRIFDLEVEDWVVQLSKGTEERIRRLGGVIIDGTAEIVEDASIDEQGRYAPGSQTSFEPVS